MNLRSLLTSYVVIVKSESVSDTLFNQKFIARVFFLDIVKPRITCPGVTSNTTIPGRSVGMVSWMEPIVEENSDNFNVSLLESASNDGEFPIGVSNVTYAVTDAAGLMDSCTFAVNVSGL